MPMNATCFSPTVVLTPLRPARLCLERPIDPRKRMWRQLPAHRQPPSRAQCSTAVMLCRHGTHSDSIDGSRISRASLTCCAPSGITLGELIPAPVPPCNFPSALSDKRPGACAGCSNRAPRRSAAPRGHAPTRGRCACARFQSRSVHRP